MYCKNCGCELKDNQNFCPKCGEKTTSDVMNPMVSSISKPSFNIQKIKKFAPIILIIFVLIIVISSISKANSPDKLIVGSWVVSEISQEERLSAYPEENFVIYDDGTFSVDGFSGNYSIHNDIITLNVGGLLGSYTYKFNVSKNSLELKNVEKGEDDPIIYYDRID